MKHFELRSGRLIGGLFAIPCSLVALVCFRQSTYHPGFLWLGFLFLGGAAIGVHLLRNPPVLVRRKDVELELYPGSLFSNRRQIVVPISMIEDVEVKTVTDRDGTSWLLSLRLREPLEVPDEARRWIDAHVPKVNRDQANEDTLLWILSWPEGGAEGARKRICALVDGIAPTP